MPRDFRTDAAVTAFLTRELLSIEARVYEQVLPPLKAQLLMDFDTSVPEAAKKWGYRTMTRIGAARWYAPGAKDTPWAKIDKDEVSFPLKYFEMGYAVEYDEAVMASALGLSLDMEHALAARMAAERFRESVLISGDSGAGFSGFINTSGIPSTNPGAKTAGGTTWAVGTADEINADMGAFLETFRAQSQESAEPNTMALPPAAFQRLNTLRMGDTTMTLRAFLRENYPEITSYVRLPALATAGAGGTGRAVLYAKNPVYQGAKFARLFSFLPPDVKPLITEVIGLEKVGGFHAKAPWAHLYIDGI